MLFATNVSIVSPLGIFSAIKLLLSLNVYDLIIPLLMLPSQGVRWNQPHQASVEQRLRSAGNCFPVRVESVSREAVGGGLSFCKARRWIWLELDCWGCFQNWVSGVVFEASLSAKLDRITSSEL